MSADHHNTVVVGGGGGGGGGGHAGGGGQAGGGAQVGGGGQGGGVDPHRLRYQPPETSFISSNDKTLMTFPLKIMGTC